MNREDGRPIRHNPFIYGRPVRASEFLGRGQDLHYIFSRIRNCESTIVVGAPKVGKTSVLRKILDLPTQRDFLGAPEKSGIFFNFLDLHPVDDDYNPALFWREALKGDLSEWAGRRAAAEAEEAERLNYPRSKLYRLFRLLEAEGNLLVLLLDEFDRLLTHPQFDNSPFFALLRSLTATGGLAVVVSSSVPAELMNEEGRKITSGSPLFNYAIQLRVAPFDDLEAGDLLDRAGDQFDSFERSLILNVAGRHPFALQMLASAFFESTHEDRHIASIGRFYQRIAPHYADLWHSLSEKARTVAVLLALAELGGKAFGKSFAHSEIQNSRNFLPELQELESFGLAMRNVEPTRVDWKSRFVLEGGEWKTGASAFSWWIQNVALADLRVNRSYDEWLSGRQYRFWLTNDQWQWLAATIGKTPEFAFRGVGHYVKMLSNELSKRNS